MLVFDIDKYHEWCKETGYRSDDWAESCAGKQCIYNEHAGWYECGPYIISDSWVSEK